jgi:bisphosphoglycerate-independent phosphoglycerate mutase (AlkP superfamily)
LGDDLVKVKKKKRASIVTNFHEPDLVGHGPTITYEWNEYLGT